MSTADRVPSTEHVRAALHRLTSGQAQAVGGSITQEALFKEAALPNRTFLTRHYPQVVEELNEWKRSAAYPEANERRRAAYDEGARRLTEAKGRIKALTAQVKEQRRTISGLRTQVAAQELELDRLRSGTALPRIGPGGRHPRMPAEAASPPGGNHDDHERD